MAVPADNSTIPKPRWYVLTPAKFLCAVLFIQGVLFLSARYRWFWFNENKGFTVLITVAATATLLVFLLVLMLASWCFKLRPRFSLFSMFLAILVAALPAAWLAREIELAHRQRATMEAVKGDFLADAEFTAGNRSEIDLPYSDQLHLVLDPFFFHDIWGFIAPDGEDVDLERLKSFTELRLLGLSESQVTDADLAHISGFTQLLTLELRNNPITDAGLEHLCGLTKLQVLSIEGTRITDEGLVRLQGLPHLTSVGLSRTQITDAGLKHLAGLTQLETLDLRGTGVTDTRLDHLKGLPKLQMIYAGGTQVTEAYAARMEVAERLIERDTPPEEPSDSGIEESQRSRRITSIEVVNETGGRISDCVVQWQGGDETFGVLGEKSHNSINHGRRRGPAIIPPVDVSWIDDSADRRRRAVFSEEQFAAVMRSGCPKIAFRLNPEEVLVEEFNDESFERTVLSSAGIEDQQPEPADPSSEVSIERIEPGKPIEVDD